MKFGAPEEREVLSRWNSCHGAYYRIHDALLRWNLEKQEFLSYKTAQLGEVSVLYCVASEYGRKKGIPESSLWLSLWSEVPPSHEAEFLRSVEQLAAREGKTRIVFGGEEFHFIPGIPCEREVDRRLVEACRGEKYTLDEVVDFVGDLGSAAVSLVVDESRSRAEAHGWEFLPVSGSGEKEALRRFLEAEFPGRWTREFIYWQEQSPARAQWCVLREKGKILGFARVASRGGKRDFWEGWNPGALRLPLGARYSADDACLGPIGVSREQRGRGAGRVLLGLALQKLRDFDAVRVCIDWTNAYKYYAPLQFGVVRRYCSAWRKLR